MVSYTDIANAANVSKAKVSKALNGRPGVNGEEALRIRGIAESMGYKDNRLVKSLVSGRSRIIGLLVHDLSNPYSSEMLMGVDMVAADNDYATVCADISRGHGRELRRLLEYRVDAMIIASTPRDPATRKELADYLGAGKPVVICTPDDYDYPEGCGYLTVDYVGACAHMVGYLHELGHTRYAWAGNIAIHPGVCSRLGGFLAGLQQAGIRPANSMVFAGRGYDDTFEGGLRVALEILRLNPRPTAVVAHNDQEAAGIMVGLIEGGMRVPEDISVCGFDGIGVYKALRPLLTTVATDNVGMGKRAALMALGVLDGDKPSRVEHGWELRIGGSTGPAPATAGE